MAKVFITGSADGLGLLAAQELIRQGHQVVLHARNTARGQQAMAQAAGAADFLIGDLSSIEETKALATKANALGKFDAVIHNAGVYKGTEGKVTADGLPLLFAVNSLAPYILTCLIQKPKRLVYLSSDMHLQGDPNLLSLPKASYSDSKLHNLLLCKAVASKWTDVYVNAVHPGWVPTKMGGPGAPDDLQQGYETQVWLATSDDPEALVSGEYFYHKQTARHLSAADNKQVQEKLLSFCQQCTGVSF